MTFLQITEPLELMTGLEIGRDMHRAVLFPSVGRGGIHPRDPRSIQKHISRALLAWNALLLHTTLMKLLTIISDKFSKPPVWMWPTQNSSTANVMILRGEAFKRWFMVQGLWHNSLNCYQQHQHHIWLPVWVLAVPLPIHFPVNVPGKAANDDSNAWDPASHIEDPDGIPRSCFGLAQPQLTVQPISGCDHPHNIHTHTLFLTHSAFLITKKKKLKDNQLSSNLMNGTNSLSSFTFSQARTPCPPTSSKAFSDSQQPSPHEHTCQWFDVGLRSSQDCKKKNVYSL